MRGAHIARFINGLLVNVYAPERFLCLAFDFPAISEQSICTSTIG